MESTTCAQAYSGYNLIKKSLNLGRNLHRSNMFLEICYKKDFSCSLNDLYFSEYKQEYQSKVGVDILKHLQYFCPPCLLEYRELGPVSIFWYS